MARQTMFDEVANDLALWIDQTATEIALALAPRTAPFAVHLTEEQKLDVYTRQLFNPDGSPNQAGRDRLQQRVGPEGFAQIYKAVVRAHPELKPPEVDRDSIEALAPMPPGSPAGPPGPSPMMGPLPGLPPGP